MIQSIIGTNIAKRMADLGIRTNKELSERSGVSRAVITNVQKNPDKKIMAETALALADGLDCRPHWLILGEGPINLDEVERANRLRFGSPVVSINELAKVEPKELLDMIFDDEGRQRHPCPAGNAGSVFIIKSSEPVGKYPSGLFYFDYEAEPVSGQLVIARPDLDSTPEVMEFYQARGKKYLKSLIEELPLELRTTEFTNEMKILATFKSFAIV